MQNQFEKKTGIIVFLDAVGTRGVWLRRSPDEIFDSLGRINTLIKDRLDFVKIMMKRERDSITQKNYDAHDIDTNSPELFRSALNYFSFSDTIFLAFSGTNMAENMFHASSGVSAIVIAGIGEGVLYRGALSSGEFYTSKEDSKQSHIIGPAIDEVASWYEFSNWLGVNCAPSAKYLLDVYKQKKDADKYETLCRANHLKYDVPLKNHESYCTWAIRWPVSVAIIRKYLGHQVTVYELTDKLDIEGLIARELQENRQWLLERFSRLSVGIDDYTKLVNTVRFYDYTIKYYEGISKGEKMPKDCDGVE